MLVEIVGLVIWFVQVMVICQFILGLLISFNVVNTHNQFVSSLWTAVNALLDPLLRPIRRIMPDTGAIDFSPMVLLLGLAILKIILSYIAAAAY